MSTWKRDIIFGISGFYSRKQAIPDNNIFQQAMKSGKFTLWQKKINFALTSVARIDTGFCFDVDVNYSSKAWQYRIFL